MGTKWNGKPLAEMLADLIATAKERPGPGSDLHITLDLNRELWGRIEVVASVVERDRAEAAAPPAPPPAPPPEHEEGGATVTAMRAARTRRKR